MTCFFCGKFIDKGEQDGAWTVLMNEREAHVKCVNVAARPQPQETATEKKAAG